MFTEKSLWINREDSVPILPFRLRLHQNLNFLHFGDRCREQFSVFTPRRFEAEEVISSLKLDILQCMCHRQRRIGALEYSFWRFQCTVDCIKHTHAVRETSQTPTSAAARLFLIPTLKFPLGIDSDCLQCNKSYLKQSFDYFDIRYTENSCASPSRKV